MFHENKDTCKFIYCRRQVHERLWRKAALKLFYEGRADRTVAKGTLRGSLALSSECALSIQSRCGAAVVVPKRRVVFLHKMRTCVIAIAHSNVRAMTATIQQDAGLSFPLVAGGVDGQDGHAGPGMLDLERWPVEMYLSREGLAQWQKS